MGLPSFHDGYLTGIRLCGEDTFVDLETVDGGQWYLHCHAVESLQMDDFRLGNTICLVSMTSGTVPDRAAIARLFADPHPSAAGVYHEMHARIVAERMEQVAQGVRTLVQIIPSFGADFVALCRDVSIGEKVVARSDGSQGN